MSLSHFKLDIDDLIHDFVKCDSTTFSDMKKVWLSKKFTCIYDAMPSTKLALFMQSLYSYAIGYMVSTTSLSQRLGGLYCLYCLYETQPFKPPFKIYLSLGELKKLKILVIDGKKQGIKVVPCLVNRMLEKNMFLFGSVDLNQGSVTETVNQLTELQNARVQQANKKLFADTRIEKFLHMNMGRELDLNELEKMSTAYAEAKKQAVEEASKEADIQNIKHIANGSETIGDVVGNIVGNWNAQKEVFYRQTGSKQNSAQEEECQLQLQEEQNKDDDDDDEDFGRELEMQLFEEEPQQKQEVEDFSHEWE
ncbi:Small nuclear RNA activating complex (SNAPc) subunit SNAP43 protein [Euphorbia peplus]|nr:Small nuclear RNA activating complex (SNAPc) subunit SNAP43 protein [Euphorbia peplus]